MKRNKTIMLRLTKKEHEQIMEYAKRKSIPAAVLSRQVVLDKVKEKQVMSKAVLVKSDDWEGLFIDGKLVDEGHTLNEGTERLVYFAELSDKYNFDIFSMVFKEVTDEYQKVLYHQGSFDTDLVRVWCR